MYDGKRKRSPNWLPDEKMLLLDLVQDHFCVIDNKKTDGLSMKRKLAEWEIISVEYNSQTTQFHREAEILKAQWESMKKAAKKDAKTRNTTGGGPQDPIYSRVLSLLEKRADLNNTLDSDGVDQAFPEPVTDTVSESGQLSESEQLSESDVDIKDILDTEQPISIILENDCNGQGERDLGDCHQLIRASSHIQADVSQGCKIKTNKSKNPLWVTRRRYTNSSASSSLKQPYRRKIVNRELKKKLGNKEMQKSNTISSLDILIKKEILKQERIKTRLLLVELRLKKKQL